MDLSSKWVVVRGQGIRIVDVKPEAESLPEGAKVLSFNEFAVNPAAAFNTQAARADG